MNRINQDTDMHAGDHVVVSDDKWDLVGHDLILVDLEPVPGSSQCVLKDGDGKKITVSRAAIRRV